MHPVDNSCISRKTLGKIVLVVGIVVIVAALVAAAAATILAVGAPGALLAAASVFLLSAKGMAGVASLLGVIGVGFATLGVLTWKTATCASLPCIEARGEEAAPSSDEVIKIRGTATAESKQIIQKSIQSYCEQENPIYRAGTEQQLKKSVFLVYEIDKFHLDKAQENDLNLALDDETLFPAGFGQKPTAVVLVLHNGYEKGRLDNEDSVKKGRDNIKYIYLKMDGKKISQAVGHYVGGIGTQSYYDKLLALFTPQATK